MRATHGNGCDLVFNDFVLRIGGAVVAVNLSGAVRFISADSQAVGGYRNAAGHYATRSRICRCLAATAAGGQAPADHGAAAAARAAGGGQNPPAAGTGACGQHEGAMYGEGGALAKGVRV